MPELQPPAKVLVTGANGFIAIWVVRNLLEKGYSVRATVRSADKGEHLTKYFSSYGDKFEVVFVEDITKEGAFDKAVQGVDAIEHVASPVIMTNGDPDELIIPAVKGTVSVLESASKNGSSVKRIVITSSFGAVFKENPPPRPFTELDWNEESIEIVKEKGRDASPVHKYTASKTLAEKAAWEYWNKHRANLQWDLCVLNPPFVFGPAIDSVTTPQSLKTSAGMFYQFITPSPSGEYPPTARNSWIDVRDLAEAHSRALEKEKAGGERILISAGSFTWQEIIDTANAISPPPRLSTGIATRNPAVATSEDKSPQFFIDASKAGRILGIKNHTLVETTKDILADYEARGW